MVARLTKDLKADLQDIVAKKLAVECEVATHSAKDQAVINHEVRRKMSLLNQIQDFSEAALEKAITLASTAQEGADLKSLAEAVDKISITNKLNDRHPPPAHNNVNVGMRQRISLEHAQKMIEEFEIA